MSEHYYTQSPSSSHQKQFISEILRGNQFRFATDTGVFSKRGIDFGTQLLIEHMDIPEKARILDVGCGYGPLGICAAKLAIHGSVVMIDINERALMLAKENADLNKVFNVTFVLSNLFANLEPSHFTRILSNPPIRAGKKIVHQIFMEAYDRLEQGGQLWIVIQKKQGAASALTKLESIFDYVEEVTKDKGYKIFKAVK